MLEDRETRIRQRAHAIWEAEGRPEGQDEAHWKRAAAEIDAEDGVQDMEPRKPDILKPTTALR
jgi:hypothetical protein